MQIRVPVQTCGRLLCMIVRFPTTANSNVCACVSQSSAAVCKPLWCRVRHSIAIYVQLLLFCDQSMREKAWRSRKRVGRTLLAGAAGELAGVTRLRQARPSSACTFSALVTSLMLAAARDHLQIVTLQEPLNNENTPYGMFLEV